MKTWMWLLPLIAILSGCASSVDSDATRSEFSIVRIYDPTTSTVTEPATKAYLYHAEWFPDGTKVITDTAGVSSYVRLLSDIRVLDVSAGTITNLTNTSDQDEHSPEVSPDGLKVVYVVDNQLAVMTLSNKSIATLNVSGFSPVWQPNGVGVAYEGNGIRYHNLSTESVFTTGYYPQWIDDSNLLIERISSGNIGTIYTYDTVGQTASLVCEGRNADIASDGSFIVYEKNGDIYHTTLPGLVTTLVMENATSPQVSPDDLTLAFVRSGVVYTAPLANLGTRTAIGEGERPRWSSTGKLLFAAVVYR